MCARIRIAAAHRPAFGVAHPHRRAGPSVLAHATLVRGLTHVKFLRCQPRRGAPILPGDDRGQGAARVKFHAHDAGALGGEAGGDAPASDTVGALDHLGVVVAAAAEAVVGEVSGQVVAFALFFTNFSTFLGKAMARAAEALRDRRVLDHAEADEGNLQQVVMNLVVNSRDAMPKGGQLSLRISILEVDARHVAEHPEARRRAQRTRRLTLGVVAPRLRVTAVRESLVHYNRLEHVSPIEAAEEELLDMGLVDRALFPGGVPRGEFELFLHEHDVAEEINAEEQEGEERHQQHRDDERRHGRRRAPPPVACIPG